MPALHTHLLHLLTAAIGTNRKSPERINESACGGNPDGNARCEPFR